MKSPLTGGSVTLIKELDTDYIINCYKEFNTDVSRFFQGIKKIYVYRCNDTGFEFYYPFIEGDNLFYEQLQEIDWYYPTWKWEHQIALNYIKDNINLLEIGSGSGNFLLKLGEKFSLNSIGLELNTRAISTAVSNGLNVINEDLLVHALNYKQKYSVVCSFQVMEHIANIHPVIQAQIDCLEKGGILIISVPNNDSIIHHDEKDCFNMPPHHIGLWKKKSLKAIPKVFPQLKIIKIISEPLQGCHAEWAKSIIIKRYFEKPIIIRSIYYRLKLLKIVDAILTSFIKKYNFLIKGHTILAVYKKN